jgi:hypothetical protein
MTLNEIHYNPACNINLFVSSLPRFEIALISLPCKGLRIKPKRSAFAYSRYLVDYVHSKRAVIC